MTTNTTIMRTTLILSFLLLFFPGFSHAAVSCNDTYSKDAAVPQGYGASYNVFTSAKEQLVKTASCTDTRASITVGNGDTALYVYKEGYYWTGSTWQKITFTGSSALVSNLWYTGSANASFPLGTGNSERYYVGYTCQKVGDIWKCGCSNTTCATAAWQLQKVVKTGDNNSGGPVCGNSVCEAGETVNNCSQDCQTSGGNTGAAYPVGNTFVLGLYAINNDFTKAAAAGWNVCHTYSAPPTTPSYINTCKSAGMMTMGRLSKSTSGSNSVPKSESTIADEIASMGGTNSIAFWDLPEEQRYWIPSEMNIVTQYSAWTRKYDPKKLPNYMYIPGHYGADDIAKYVKYLDIVPASAYAGYMGRPNTYVRWSIERTFKGIADAGYRVGKNYQGGEKTVMAILEIFPAGDSRMSPTQSRHDFWLSVASDVKGILVYAYHYRNSSVNLGNCMAALSDAADKFKGAHLDRVMIEGTTNTSVNFTITSGPERTAKLTPPDGSGALDYPSLKVLAKTWNGSTYIIAVNSNTSPVTANITGLPSGSSATALFENRNVPVNSGTITDTFIGLGFHVYKL